MRKLIPSVAVLLSVTLLVSGCDFFRKLAGRPTSADIEAKRELIRVEEEREEALRLEELRKAAETQVDTTTVKEATPPATGKKRFYIVMATFSSEENARKFLSRMDESGYPGELLGFKGGYTAVGICGTDDEDEAKESLRQIRRQDFCPEGVWILDRNKR